MLFPYMRHFSRSRSASNPATRQFPRMSSVRVEYNHRKPQRGPFKSQHRGRCMGRISTAADPGCDQHRIATYGWITAVQSPRHATKYRPYSYGYATIHRQQSLMTVLRPGRYCTSGSRRRGEARVRPACRASMAEVDRRHPCSFRNNAVASWRPGQVSGRA